MVLTAREVYLGLGVCLPGGGHGDHVHPRVEGQPVVLLAQPGAAGVNLSCASLPPFLGR